VTSGHISFNRVVKNKVALTSSDPMGVDVYGIGLNEVASSNAVKDNNIGFNDLRDSVTLNQILLSPSGLGDVNRISRNLGDNRGHGLHPCVFVGNSSNCELL
jgi:hypothetical protein